jgi:hypothetical protein
VEVVVKHLLNILLELPVWGTVLVIVVAPLFNVVNMKVK